MFASANDRNGSIAASGLKTLNDCSQSDPAFGARPQQ